jgi:hypothetical protein
MASPLGPTPHAHRWQVLRSCYLASSVGGWIGDFVCRNSPRGGWELCIHILVGHSLAGTKEGTTSVRPGVDPRASLTGSLKELGQLIRTLNKK